MDPVSLHPAGAPGPDRVVRDLVEIDAAIELVAAGFATRVRLAGLGDDDGILAIGLAHAQAAGIAFSIERRPGRPAGLTLGPAL